MGCSVQISPCAWRMRVKRVAVCVGRFPAPRSEPRAEPAALGRLSPRWGILVIPNGAAARRTGPRLHSRGRVSREPVRHEP
jgi:hypothetical protein